MKAIDRPFTKIINGTTQFVIPVFQRDYDWEEVHCEKLWNDIVRVGKSGSDRGHFIGSIVYIAAGDSSAGFTRWLLIDGQQRVTTLTLVLMALRRHILDSGWEPTNDDDPTPKRIEAYFLKNLQERGDREHKLVLRRHDEATLRALLDEEGPPENASVRILENYEYFLDKLSGEDPAAVYRGIGRLIVVDVTLDRATDDPQMIFESLNATGLDLTQADLIRNYILMRVPETEQTRLYEKYWSRIEVLFRGAAPAFDTFARDYMALNTKAAKQARADEIYHAFREFFRDREQADGLDATLEDMLRYAGYHAAFTLGRQAPTGLSASLAGVNRLAEVAAILVMKLSDFHHHEQTLSEKDFNEALRLLESYVFRRSICGMQTRGYWQVFAGIAYRIDAQKPLESLGVALARMRERYRFPRDQEFARDLEQRDVYGMRTCHYMLDRLENHGSLEPTDTSSYSVEHVLPQNESLAKAWRDMLGKDWQQAQRTWLHRLGNVTLTGYNSTYSDRSFEEKKSIPGGFNESSVRLNKHIREQQTWTPQEIESRGKALAERALSIWPPLVVSDEAIAAAKLEDLRTRARSRAVDQVPMSARARVLFDAVRPHVRAIDPSIVELAETRSVSYHAGEFFLEVLPRKNRLVLLLNLDFSECDASDEQARDATERSFLVNAKYEGGAYYRLDDEAQTESALRLIRRAHELASS